MLYNICRGGMHMLSKLPENLYEKIKEGESTTIEFKKAKEKLPSSLFESICDFLSFYK